MVVNGLLNMGIALFGLGLLMFYGITWVVLFFMCWANIDDETYSLAFVFLSALVLWTGIGILCIALVL